jgi:hypothetical protein
VRGHQKAKSDLDYNKQISILADSLTRKARKVQTQQRYHKFPTNSVDLAIPDNYITGCYQFHTLAIYHSVLLKNIFVQNAIGQKMW